MRFSPAIADSPTRTEGPGELDSDGEDAYTYATDLTDAENIRRENNWRNRDIRQEATDLNERPERIPLEMRFEDYYWPMIT